MNPNSLPPEVKQPNHQVTDGDTLQHAINPHVGKRKKRKRVDHNSQQKQNPRPPHRTPGQLGARGAAGQPRLNGKDDGGAHHE